MEVAEIVMREGYDAGKKNQGLCYLVNRVNTASIVDFPELQMFIPKIIIHQNGVSRWWDIDDKESRIICMLLCSEMTKTENL